jgi:hypothetical protein
MHMRAHTSAGVKFTDAELLMYRTVRPIHNDPTAKAAADLFKGLGDFEIFLVGRADDMSGLH